MKKTGHAEFEKQIEITRQQDQRNTAKDSTDIFKILPWDVIRRIFKFIDITSQMEILRTTREAQYFRTRDRQLRRTAQFSLRGSIVLPAVRSIADERINTIYSSSQSAWNTIVTLRIKGKLRSVTKLHLHSLDLSDDQETLNALRTWKLEKITVKKCLVSEKCVSLLLSKLEAQKIYFSECRSNQVLVAPVLTDARRIMINVQETRIYRNGHFGHENGTEGLYRRQDGSIYKCIYNEKLVTSHLEHVLIDKSYRSLQYLYTNGRNLRSIHFLNGDFNLAEFLDAVPYLTNLVEIGIHSYCSRSGSTVIEPRSLVDRLLCGSRKRLLCLPILESLPSDRLRSLANTQPKCRLVFDAGLSYRIARRHWKLPKQAQ